VLEVLSDEEARSHADSRVSEYVAHRRREALQRLDSLVPGWALVSGRVSTLVELGRPAPAIVCAADARQADLIVMGAHGQGGGGLALFGSATQGVLRHATCPVLTATATDSRGHAASIPLSASAQAGG
jgi:nucleotide-binding universal stress UspA family protein